jgi:hypothetical protein
VLCEPCHYVVHHYAELYARWIAIQPLPAGH